MTQPNSSESFIGGNTHAIPDSDIVVPQEGSRENQQPLPAQVALKDSVARIATIDQRGADELARRANRALRRARPTSSQ